MNTLSFDETHHSNPYTLMVLSISQRTIITSAVYALIIQNSIPIRYK